MFDQFDQLVSDTTGTSGAAAVAAWARVESAACARKLAAMASMLDTAYAASGSADREQWICDNVDAVCAHIGAALRITSGAASGLLLIAVTLRDRLPTVAEVFADGLVSFAMVRAIVTRSSLVLDADALRALDAAVAEALRSWEPMSVDRAEKAIDALIHQVDPHAVRRTEAKAKSRSVQVTIDDGSGVAEVVAILFAQDARACEARLNAMAATVCPADPRTLDQRRADAMGAVMHGADRLGCLCEHQDCPAAQNPPSTGVIIHLVAHHDTITGPGGSAGPTGSGGSAGPSGSGGSGGPAAPTPEAPHGPHVPDDQNPPDATDPDESDEPLCPDALNGGAPDRDEPEGPGGLGMSDAPTDSDESDGPDADEPLAPSNSDGARTEGSAGPALSGSAPAADHVTAASHECAGLDGVRPPLFTTPLPEMTLTQALTDPDPGCISALAPASFLGGPIIPGAIACRAARGATLIPIIHPGAAPPEPHYRPSKKLADFVRCRDQTCRYPGCRVPATHCDLDHTIAWPHGPTQASNLACLCRRHHLLKTFWIRDYRWAVRQLPDGTLIWTMPDGRTETTTPGSRLLFPGLCEPTAPATTTGHPPPTNPDTAGLKMPRRKTTRTHDRAQRITTEREHNQAIADAEAELAATEARDRAADDTGSKAAHEAAIDPPF